MKTKLLIGIVCSIFGSPVNAQVSDVSITITPQIGYNWFDNKSTVEDGTMYGFQAGFGFGKVIELRGIWERSLNLKQKFGMYESDIQELFPDFNLEDRNIKVSRWGGEFKTNLPIGGLSPYLVLGTGVQNFETTTAAGTTYKNENLYGSGGLGFKISLGQRTTLNLEGRGLVYNMNPGNLLYNEGGSSQFDDWINNSNRSTMYNWSVMAGLQFYLGGRTNDDMDALDRAYLSRFSGGLAGTKLTLSPAGSYINFNNRSGYKDTYMLGGIVGVEFSHYAGLQGYYYKSTKDEKIQFDFDDLEIYGADFVGNLISSQKERQSQLFIVLKGFASQSGSAFYNNRLSFSRADAVKQLLVHGGVNPGNILTLFHGSDGTVRADEARRVEINLELLP